MTSDELSSAVSALGEGMGPSLSLIVFVGAAITWGVGAWRQFTRGV